MLKYKGYLARVEVDIDRKNLFGSVVGAADSTITFQGDTVPELIQVFHDSVDDYIEFCEKQGVAPEKSFSGSFPFRTTPELHREIYLAAEQVGKSMNAWIEDVLRGAVEAIKKPD